VSGADRVEARDTDAACAKTVLSALARRGMQAANAAEIDRLLSFYNTGRQTGGTFDAGIEMRWRSCSSRRSFCIASSAIRRATPDGL
jgi:hypothetical protein